MRVDPLRPACSAAGISTVVVTCHRNHTARTHRPVEGGHLCLVVGLAVTAAFSARYSPLIGATRNTPSVRWRVVRHGFGRPTALLRAPAAPAARITLKHRAEHLLAHL